MKFWTNKEIARLKEVCAMEDVFSIYLSEFPGRTVEALRHQAKRNGFQKKHIYPGRPPVSQMKVMTILNKRDACRAELAKALGIRECTMSEILQRMRLAGKVYLKEHKEGRGRERVWSSSERLQREVLGSSPFAAAAGAVRIPAGGQGRVYRRMWDTSDDEMEAA